MVEMAAHDQDGLYRRGVAGDSYNTAVYLARAGLPVGYLTRLGDDALSEDIVHRITSEGISSQWIERCKGRQPGLYLIDNDTRGERHFHYWREQAPVRELFSRPVHLPGVDVFYFTGITLAVAHAGTGLQNLLALLSDLRQQGCQIVFDPNYRPALWESTQQAQECYRAVLPLCEIVLPTLEDEIKLWGIATIANCHAHYRELGVKELVIKGPALTAHVYAGDEQFVQQAKTVPARDTTGAGDAFNAGYLAARLRGGDIKSALDRAQQLSATVVQHIGAITPRY